MDKERENIINVIIQRIIDEVVLDLMGFVRDQQRVKVKSVLFFPPEESTANLNPGIEI
jgi:hypothetical protein